MAVPILASLSVASALATSNSEEELDRLLNRARLASLIGVVLISLLFVMDIVIGAVTLMAFIKVGVNDTYTATWWMMNGIGGLLFLAVRILMVLFLWHFWRDANPLTIQQARRLSIAGILLLGNVINATLSHVVPEIMVVEGNTPVEFSESSPSGINLRMFVFAVFVFCTVQVLRYVSALKNESDAII